MDAGQSVIIPVYNRATTILGSLTSVARQSLPPSELIVVDDGSSDALQDSLDRWRRRERPAFPVRLIRQARHGAPSARNRGLAAAQGAAFVAFLDSDDAWPPDFLERCRGALAARPDAVAASCDMLAVDCVTGRRVRTDVAPIAAAPTRWMFANRTGIGSATLFRAEGVRRLGGYDTSLPTGHDAALFLRLSLLGPWLHSAGLPVTYGRNTALSCGEHDHLRNQFVNHEHRWAAIREDFIERGGGRAVLPATLCNQQMSLRWYRAGRNWYDAGRMRAARQCFLRSLHYQGTGRTLAKLLATYLRRAA